MSVIDDYLKQVPEPERAELERIRAIAHAMLPDVVEAISYGMPTIKFQGKSILGFDAHRHHIGVYPFSGSVISQIEELSTYDTTPGAIREKLDQPLPKALIEKVIRVRLRQLGLDTK